jgi:hypothetical protein
MNQTITVKQIQETKTFKSLNPIQQSFVLKRKNREQLSHGLVVYRNTDVIPGDVFGYNLDVLKDIINYENKKTE